MFQIHLFWLVSFLSSESWVTPCGSDWGTPTSSGCVLHTVKNGDSGEYWCVSRYGASCRGINITVMGRGTANKMMHDDFLLLLISWYLRSIIQVGGVIFFSSECGEDQNCWPQVGRGVFILKTKVTLLIINFNNLFKLIFSEGWTRKLVNNFIQHFKTALKVI